MNADRIRSIYEIMQYKGFDAIEVPDPVVVEGPTPSAELRWHVDARGSLIELWRRSWGPKINGLLDWYDSWESAHLGHVSHVYVSTTRPGVVKAWHAHTRQTDRFVVVRGAVLVGLCDLTTTEDLKVHEVVLDCQRGPRVLTIPPGVAHGWMALDHADGESWVLNLCSHEYDGSDEFRRPAHEGPAPGVKYDWRRSRDG